MVIEVVDPNSSITNRKEKIRVLTETPDKKIKMVKVSGSYDKKTIIDQLENFVTENQIVEEHPDLKIQYQKHCDGWRGFVGYEDKDKEPEPEP